MIAAEAAKVYPELVQYDKAGKPATIYYHLLTPMLPNGLHKTHRQYDTQKTEIAGIKAGECTTIRSATASETCQPLRD